MRRKALGLTASLLLAAPALATPIDWHLYGPSCTGGAGAVEIACGNRGRYLLLQTTAPPGCVPLAEGAENPPGYPKQVGQHAFPVPARDLRDATPQPVPVTTNRRANGLRRTGSQAIVVQEQPAPVQRWVAVVDFDSPHGDSTTWLADYAAGPQVGAELTTLDDAVLNVLGEVSDFHVLAKLCAIAQIADSGPLQGPTTVNMSFGRPKRGADPTSPSACPLPNAACEIAKVVRHLKAGGSHPVAASGNHRAQLFPAMLDDVISTGMLDLNTYLAGTLTRPAWETPIDADAWMPGNGLCLRNWAAPAGSSYSSAILAGWLVRVIDNPTLFNSLPEGPWYPAWDAVRRCIVLAKGRRLTPYCNAAVSTVFGGLSGAPNAGCGTRGTEPTFSPTPPPVATTPATLASIDTWGDPTHPAPESDPCVPCSGSIFNTSVGGDLHLDLSHSGPLPLGIHLDEVSLRVDDSYYPLDLLDAELQVFEDGGLAALVIPAAGSLIPPGASLSLWYRMKEGAGTDCATSNACFWSSTPLLLGTSVSE